MPNPENNASMNFVSPELKEWILAEYEAGYAARFADASESLTATHCRRVGWEDANTELSESARRSRVIAEGGEEEFKATWFAISNHRLVALTNQDVTFRWRDSAHGNKKRRITLPVDEFLRRFLLHLLPRGFVRIRNFGFLANRQRAQLLPLCFRLLQAAESIPVASVSLSTVRPHSPWKCPVCGAITHVLDRLSAAQLLLRSPPFDGDAS